MTPCNMGFGELGKYPNTYYYIAIEKKVVIHLEELLNTEWKHVSLSI